MFLEELKDSVKTKKMDELSVTTTQDNTAKVI